MASIHSHFSERTDYRREMSIGFKDNRVLSKGRVYPNQKAFYQALLQEEPTTTWKIHNLSTRQTFFLHRTLGMIESFSNEQLLNRTLSRECDGAWIVNQDGPKRHYFVTDTRHPLRARCVKRQEFFLSIQEKEKQAAKIGHLWKMGFQALHLSAYLLPTIFLSPPQPSWAQKASNWIKHSGEELLPALSGLRWGTPAYFALRTLFAAQYLKGVQGALGDEVSIKMATSQTNPSATFVDNTLAIAFETDSKVYIQLVDLNSDTLLNTPFRIGTSNSLREEDPHIITLGNNNGLCTWVEGKQLLSQQFNSSGSLVGDQIVITHSLYTPPATYLTRLPNGQGVSVWVQRSSSYYSAVIHRFSKLGEKLGSTFSLYINSACCAYPYAAPDNNGVGIIATHIRGTASYIQASFYDSQNKQQQKESYFRVRESAYLNRDASLVTLPNNFRLFAWTEDPNPTGSSLTDSIWKTNHRAVYVHWLDSNYALFTSNPHLVSPSDKECESQDIIPLSSGRVKIVYSCVITNNPNLPGNSDIFEIIYDSFVQNFSDINVVNADRIGDQRNPTGASIDDSHVVVWENSGDITFRVSREGVVPTIRSSHTSVTTQKPLSLPPSSTPSISRLSIPVPPTNTLPFVTSQTPHALPTLPAEESPSGPIGSIVGGVSGGIILIAGIITVLWCRTRRNRDDNPHSNPLESPPSPSSSSAPSQIYDPLPLAAMTPNVPISAVYPMMESPREETPNQRGHPQMQYKDWPQHAGVLPPSQYTRMSKINRQHAAYESAKRNQMYDDVPR